MNYPFLYQCVDRLDFKKLKSSLVYTGEKHSVWQDWSLLCVESDFVRNYLSEKFSHLKVFENKLFISSGTQSNFHLDRFHIHHILHRILIPLNDNFHYEWAVGGNIKTFCPQLGDVIIFNNMVPHRFVSKDKENREVIYIDLYDPLVQGHFEHFKGNYSSENAILAEKYK